MSAKEEPRSVVFAELSGHARLHEKLGNSEALRALERCVRRMRRAVEAGSGRIVSSAGHQLVAVFDLADKAVHAAFEMQQRVADLPPVSGVKLAIRVGFAHGALREEGAGVAGAAADLAAQLAAIAEPGQILTDLQSRAALSSALQSAARDLGAPASEKNGAMSVFELLAAGLPLALHKVINDNSPRPERAVQQGPCLRLRYEGQEHTLDDTAPVIRLGRGANNHIVINDRRASRDHARIERRGGQLVVIDTSANGTYVTLKGRPELSLRQGDCVIHGLGQICFARPASDADADCAEFEAF